MPNGVTNHEVFLKTQKSRVWETLKQLNMWELAEENKNTAMRQEGEFPNSTETELPMLKTLQDLALHMCLFTWLFIKISFTVKPKGEELLEPHL